jgi:hypothetical protein
MGWGDGKREQWNVGMMGVRGNGMMGGRWKWNVGMMGRKTGTTKTERLGWIFVFP